MAVRKKSKSPLDNIYVKAGGVTVGLIVLYSLFNKSTAATVFETKEQEEARKKAETKLSLKSTLPSMRPDGTKIIYPDGERGSCDYGKVFYKNYCITTQAYEKVKKEYLNNIQYEKNKIAEEQKMKKIQSSAASLGGTIGTIVLPGAGTLFGTAAGYMVGYIGTGMYTQFKKVEMVTEPVKMNETSKGTFRNRGGQGVRIN